MQCKLGDVIVGGDVHEVKCENVEGFLVEMLSRIGLYDWFGNALYIGDVISLLFIKHQVIDQPLPNPRICKVDH